MCRARRKAQEYWICIPSIFNDVRRKKILLKLPYPYVNAPKRVVLILKRRIIPLLLLVLLTLSCLPVSAETDGPAAMILYEPRTGAVLEALNADEPMLIASTTKIMTAMVVLERCTLHESVTVLPDQVLVEGSSAALQPWETYTVEELLYGLMLASGNDAACVLAEHTAGSIEAFAELMNEKVAELGLENTHFVNPHGLNDDEHYSSARDLAIMTAAAMKNETFCTIFGTARYTIHGVEFVNHNKLLESCPGCIGGKTGYTRAAGRTLVSCVERDGLRLICVTLHDANDWVDHTNSYDRAFSAYRYLPFPAQRWSQIPVITGTAAYVDVGCELPGALVHSGAQVETLVELPRFVFAPVEAGDVLGRVTVTENGRTVCTAELTAVHAVARDDDEGLLPWRPFWKNWTRRCAGTFTFEDYLI